MKLRLVLGFAVLSAAGCSLLNEDAQVDIDCEANQFATDCVDGFRVGCNADREVVAVACADTLVCEPLTIGQERKGVCAPDCDSGSTSKVCEANLLLECRSGRVTATDCGALTCTALPGMGAECQ